MIDFEECALVQLAQRFLLLLLFFGGSGEQGERGNVLRALTVGRLTKNRKEDSTRCALRRHRKRFEFRIICAAK